MSIESNHAEGGCDGDQIAAVYAKAFLGAAETAGRTDAWVAELQSLVGQVIDVHPDLTRLLTSPFISEEEKNRILERVFQDRVSGGLMIFLQVLLGRDRFAYLAAIGREVARRYHALCGRVEVRIKSASPLSEVLILEIVASLRNLLGAEPELTVSTDPDLIGGLVVSVGDTVYDGSVVAQLNLLRAEMVRHSVEAIETNQDRFLMETV